MCIYRKLFLESEIRTRLIWDEKPSPRPASTWGDPGKDLETQWGANTGAGGTETDWRPPEYKEALQATGHIDPGLPVTIRNGSDVYYPQKLQDRFPKIKDIIDKLDEIEQTEFWGKNTAALAGADLDQMRGILVNIKEATLCKALVENWTKEILFAEFTKEMGDLYTQCASRPWLQESWGWVKIGFHGLIGSENLGDSKNSFLIEGVGKRKISPQERGKIMIPLMALETRIKQEVLTPNWARDPRVNTDQLEFVVENAIPQYRVAVIDKAIIHNYEATDSNNNHIPDAIETEYVGILRGLYRSCIIVP